MFTTSQKFHPLTGHPIVPAGRRKDGRPIWPIIGAAEPAAPPADAPPADAPPADQPPAVTPPADTPPADAPPTEDTPAVIKALRDDFKTERTKRQEAETKQADLIQKLGKALGLVDGDKAPTVEELATQLTEQTSKTETASAVARDTQAELVVWKNAADLGVDASALTDSRAFAAAIQDLDPTDAKFVEAVKKAAQAAAEANPKLKAAPAAGKSGAEIPGGSGEGAVTPEQFKNMSGAERNELARRDPTTYARLSGRT